MPITSELVASNGVSNDRRPEAASVAIVAGPAPADSFRPVDRAYAGIREAILDGSLKPGEHLREEPLAALTGTSRTPVREALRRLVTEGLATAVNRHRYVTHFSYDEVAVIFDVRARLESYAAQIASTTITDGELTLLKAIVEDIDRVALEDCDDRDQRFGELNARFHTTIVGATRSRQLGLLIAPTLALPLDMIKRRVWEQPLGIGRSNQQHREIIAALESGDGQWASAAMSSHILSTKPVATNRRFAAKPSLG